MDASEWFSMRTRHSLRPRAPVAHLVGVSGSGMKALAELLADAQWTLSGSDLLLPEAVVDALAPRGVRLSRGHHREHVPAQADCLIYSPAVPEDNPERRAARERGLPEWSYPQILGRLMTGRRGVAVAGTHGKSTTTALIGWMLRHSGRDAALVCGAESVNLGVSGCDGKGPQIVVEACEYRRHFLHMKPEIGVILGIEADHVDYFRDLEDVTAAFAEFAANVASDGWLVCRGDCPATMQAARRTSANVVTFADLTSKTVDWAADDVRRHGQGHRFIVRRRGRRFAELTLPIPGRHHIGNALAAVAVAEVCGVAPDEMEAALLEFRGVRRRFEMLGTWNGIVLIDDYAHHPTAVAATIQTAREGFPGRRLWCAFQPHQVSRTLALMDDFAAGFGEADEVLIGPVFAARETTEAAAAASRELAHRIALRGVRARFVPSLDRIAATMQTEARPGDVFLTMGAGDIDRVHHEFTGRLQRHHAS